MYFIYYKKPDANNRSYINDLKCDLHLEHDWFI